MTQLWLGLSESASYRAAGWQPVPGQAADLNGKILYASPDDSAATVTSCPQGYEVSYREEGGSECVPVSGHYPPGYEPPANAPPASAPPAGCPRGNSISYSEIQVDFWGNPQCPEGYTPDTVQPGNPLLFQPAYGACVCSSLPPEEAAQTRSEGRNQYREQKKSESETGLLGVLGSIEQILPTLVILAVVSAVLGLFKK